MICVNKIFALCIFAGLPNSGLLANEQPKEWEAQWERELSGFYGLSLPDSLALAKTRWKLTIVEAVKVDTNKEEEKAEETPQSFYSAYFASQRFRPYSALLILPQQALPGDFKKRPLEDETILIINAQTTRESVYHLFLHLITDRKLSLELAAKIQLLRKEKPTDSIRQEIREHQLTILTLDSEVEKDLFIIAKAKDLQIPTTEKPILLLRIEKNIQRLETELKSMESLKEKQPELFAAAEKKLADIKTQLKAIKTPQ